MKEMKIEYNNQKVEIGKLNIITGVSTSENNKFVGFLKENTNGFAYYYDYPEIHRHPSLLLNIVRDIVGFINTNEQIVVLVTHNDYIIKELNNLLMLSHDFPSKNKLLKEFGIEKVCTLHPKDLKAYIVNTDGTITQSDIDEYGMVESGFDDVILQINKKSNKIINAINES